MTQDTTTVRRVPLRLLQRLRSAIATRRSRAYYRKQIVAMPAANDARDERAAAVEQRPGVGMSAREERERRDRLERLARYRERETGEQ